jgi:hypothetical protein
MKTFFHRFIWKDKDERFVPFLVFFTLQNLMIGILFCFGFWIPGISELKLWTVLTQFLPPPFSALVWGVGLVVVFIGHCLEMYFRGEGFGPPTAMLGFILWCYALGVYLSELAVLGIIGVVFPQLFFWSWYYFEAKAYRREIKVVARALE